MATTKGYREVKKLVISALNSGSYQHEVRSEVDTKNLLLMGQVTATEIAQVIKNSVGTDHACSPHHNVSGVDVHIIKSGGWYIKFYFINLDTWFISVHK